MVFLAIGFETTTPPTALVVRQAAAMGLTNFSVFCNHVLTPSAIAHILESPEVRELGTVKIDGFVGPGARLDHHRQPALRLLRRGIREARRHRRLRAARRHAGHPHAGAPGERRPRRGGERVLARGDAPTATPRRRRWWRRSSSCAARSSGGAWGACRTARCGSRTSGPPSTPSAASTCASAACADNKACECGAILRGVKKPTDCKVFGTVCTPETPIGSCMVSSEGACAAHYTYGRFRSAA